jgi:hypothetical protein
MIEYLIQKNCDINKLSKLKRSGLSKACYLDLYMIVEYLLQNKERLKIDIN